MSQRNLVFLAIGLSLTFLNLGCDSDNTTQTSLNNDADLPFLYIESCSDMSIDPTMSYVSEYIDERINIGDLSEVAPASGYTQKTVEAIKRGYMLPCVPDIDTENPESTKNPENINTVMKILTEDRWKGLTSHMLENEIAHHTEAEGWAPVDQDSFTYENFLRVIARYPYFCAEKGYFDTVEDACIREIAAIFAHGAQETGGDSSPKWKAAFSWVREDTTFNDNRYDPGSGECAEPLICPDEAHYFGRGIKQLSYYYNYAGFSGSNFSGEYNMLLENPDAVAISGFNAFGSGLWFFMNPQPPKPSMHEVLLGIYTPKLEDGQSFQGITASAKTGVKYNFEVTTSIINGGVECGLKDTDKYYRASINRSQYYISLIEYFGGTPTAEEQEKSNAGCNFIAKGNPFSVLDGGIMPLKWDVTVWLEQKSCEPVSWDTQTYVSIINDNCISLCR